MDEREKALQDYLANPCDETRNNLVAQHHGLIHFVVDKKMRVPRELQADAFQEGMVGLIRGIQCFDPSKGAFASHAILWIRAEVQIWMERDIRQNRCAPMKRNTRYRNTGKNAVDGESRRVFSTHFGDEGGDQQSFSIMETVADSAPGPLENLDANFVRRRMRQALAKFTLSERELAIMDDHIINDVSLQVLSERFGVSKQRMSKIKEQLLVRLKESFDEQGGREHHH